MYTISDEKTASRRNTPLMNEGLFTVNAFTSSIQFFILFITHFHLFTSKQSQFIALARLDEFFYVL